MHLHTALTADPPPDSGRFAPNDDHRDLEAVVELEVDEVELLVETDPGIEDDDIEVSRGQDRLRGVETKRDFLLVGSEFKDIPECVRGIFVSPNN